MCYGGWSTEDGLKIKNLFSESRSVGSINHLLPNDYPGILTSAIALGTGHTCALTTGGQVWCWGWNYLGQLGINSTISQAASPVAVTFGSGSRHSRRKLLFQMNPAKRWCNSESTTIMITSGSQNIVLCQNIVLWVDSELQNFLKPSKEELNWKKTD